jgi:hypothetical protein
MYKKIHHSENSYRFCSLQPHQFIFCAIKVSLSFLNRIFTTFEFMCKKRNWNVCFYNKKLSRYNNSGKFVLKKQIFLLRLLFKTLLMASEMDAERKKFTSELKLPLLLSKVQIYVFFMTCSSFEVISGYFFPLFYHLIELKAMSSVQ